MKKKILLVTGGILVLALGIILIPQNSNNKINNETEINLAELETNSVITNKNSKTIVADETDKNLTAQEFIEKYDIPVFNEKESKDNNITETKEFKETNFSKNEDNINSTELETETGINLDSIEVSAVSDNYTSETSNHVVPVVANPEPTTTPETVQAIAETETEPETTIALENIDYTGMVWNNTKEERAEIYKKGEELIQTANLAGLNTSGLSTVLYVLDNRAYFEPDGTIPFLEIAKDYVNDCYNVDIYVSVNPEKSMLNNSALKELCKLISFNNNNVYDSIMEDYLNETLIPDQWTDSGKGFSIKYFGDKEKHLTRYSIKY